MNMDKETLAFLPALEISNAIAKKEISSQEVVLAALDRAERTQETLNAFITICRDKALEKAIKADSEVSASAELSPLHGVPLTVKDLINTSGVRTTMGSRIFDENFPSADAVAIERLNKAGAILIGKTTTPEFGHKPFTSAPIFGQTVNAWDQNRIAGGSSGGAAVAAAAGLGTLHVGTDGGGSIRIPAAANGVVGMKPTLGTVPNDSNPDSFGNYSYTGPITRTVSDSAAMLTIMAGNHSSDVHSMGRIDENYLNAAINPGDLKGKKIGWRHLMGNSIIDAEVLRITKYSLNALQSAGAEIIEMTDEFESPEPFWRIINQSAWKARFGKYIKVWEKEMTPSLLRSLNEAENYTGAELQEAIYKRTELFRKIQGWFNKFDFVVTPTLSRTALETGNDLYDQVTVAGMEAGIVRQAWYPYTHPFNLTGHPAITLPSGFHSDGLPTGLQIIGPYASDYEVIRCARIFEIAQPWESKKPYVPNLH